MDKHDLLKEVAGDASAAQLILPGEQVKFDTLCTKMGFKKQPSLVVVDDKQFSAMTSEYESAHYRYEYNCVVMRQSVFEQFCKGDVYAQYQMAHELGLATYIMAHELGHGLYHANRRAFLGQAGAVLAGLVAGGGSGFATKYATRAVLPEKKKRSVIADVLALPIGAGMGYAAWRASKSRLPHEELVADQYAAQALSPDMIFDVLVAHEEKALRAEGDGAVCDSWRAEIEEAAKEVGLDPAECARDMQLAFGMRLAFETHDKWYTPVEDPTYPNHSDRIREMYQLIRSPLVEPLLCGSQGRE